jgi:hypothetical protein
LGGRFINGSGAWRGENVNVCLDVIASEAKQSILTFFVLDGLLVRQAKLAWSCR